jgi:O-antigen ligase
MAEPFRSPVALVALAAIAAVMVAVAARPIAVRPGWARGVILAAAVAFVAVLATTIALGVTYRHGDEAGGDTLQRVALWHGALEILLDHPTGVGPGRFDDVPPHYLPEGDVRWADHDFLQQGAELGWLGLVTTVLLFAWGFARAWVHPRPDAYVALGAVAVAAVGILASVDHVLHVVAIPIVAAALVGSSQASTRGEH